jgi:hypothetical protein
MIFEFVHRLESFKDKIELIVPCLNEQQKKQRKKSSKIVRNYIDEFVSSSFCITTTIDTINERWHHLKCKNRSIQKLLFLYQTICMQTVSVSVRSEFNQLNHGISSRESENREFGSFPFEVFSANTKKTISDLSTQS